MSSFEAQIEKSRKEVAEAQSKITELSGKIETARTKMAQGTDITLDIENASLEDVHAHSDMMNANIAELKILTLCGQKQVGKNLWVSSLRSARK